MSLFRLTIQLLFLNSSFIGNIAGFGGGLSTYASSVRKIKHYNHFDCINCLFVNNSAQCGAAVSASRGVFTKYGSKFINRVYFTDCKFEGNIVIFQIYHQYLRWQPKWRILYF